MKKYSRTRCAKHNSPMRFAQDPFGNQTMFVCLACQKEKLSEKYALKGDFEKAKDLLGKAQVLSGRWFEVRTLTGVHDMSQGQINAAVLNDEQVTIIKEII